MKNDVFFVFRLIFV